MNKNESLFIKVLRWHELKNLGEIPLKVIEVQVDSYLGEDDIVR